MASAARLPIRTIAVTTALALALGASRIDIRDLAVKFLTSPGKYSRLTVAAVLLLNLKNVPWAWHFRVLNAMLKHCVLSLPRIPPSLAPSTLFLPVITTSHAPFYECDYNFHKSNSTYFSDLDITRSHLVCVLFQEGLAKLHHNPKEKLVLDNEGKPVKGSFGIMLGGTMCTFKREIGMYQSYEMWSRLLAWDRKWIYVITHFVKKGTVKPSAYVVEDGTWFGGKGYRTVKGHYSKGKDVDEKAIFASAISKYVIKLGRLTIHPEVLLDASGMLPPRPGGWHTMAGGSGDVTPEQVATETGDVEVVEASEGQESTTASTEWDWKRTEAEKAKGVKYVENFAALDGLNNEFTGSSTAALGKFRDFLM